MSIETMDRSLIGKAYRMEGLINCARLAEDNDNWPALRETGTGIAQLLEAMADVMGEISEGIELLDNKLSAANRATNPSKEIAALTGLPVK